MTRRVVSGSGLYFNVSTSSWDGEGKWTGLLLNTTKIHGIGNLVKTLWSWLMLTKVDRVSSTLFGSGVLLSASPVAYCWYLPCRTSQWLGLRNMAGLFFEYTPGTQRLWLMVGVGPGKCQMVVCTVCTVLSFNPIQPILLCGNPATKRGILSPAIQRLFPSWQEGHW